MAENGDQSLQIDPIIAAVSALRTEDNISAQQLTAIVGHVGEEIGDLRRVYLDLESKRYIDIPSAAIVRSYALPEPQGTILWLRQDAEVTISARVQAQFLSGSDFGGVAAQPSLARSQGGLPASTPVCFSWFWRC